MKGGAIIATVVLVLMLSGIVFLYALYYNPFGRTQTSSVTSLFSMASSSESRISSQSIYSSSIATSLACSAATIPGRTLVVPSQIQTITEAIALSSRGDEIEVLPGNYTGFVVNKSIDVVACNSDASIHGGIIISTNDSVVSGFTIYGSSPITNNLTNAKASQQQAPNGSIILAFGASNNTVSKNLLFNFIPNATSLFGISIWTGRFNTITNNSLVGYTAGVTVSSYNYTVFSYGNVISWNMVFVPSFSEGRISGIVDVGANTKILDNTIHTCIDGIILTGYNATVNGNAMQQCVIGVEAAPLLGPSLDNRIYGNNFIGNQEQALDNGTNNVWYVNHTGNYWSDWNNTTVPRPINGTAKTYDAYPLASPYAPAENTTTSFVSS